MVWQQVPGDGASLWVISSRQWDSVPLALMQSYGLRKLVMVVDMNILLNMWMM